MRKRGKVGLGLLGSFLLIQLVPFGREHDNPPMRREPAWDSPETRELAVRACFDCHSHQTRWPWYTWVAPASWLATNDVMGGRHHLNFSRWDLPQRDADEAIEAVLEGDMPLAVYTPFHPEAKLTEAERRRLAEGLRSTPGFERKESNHRE